MHFENVATRFQPIEDNCSNKVYSVQLEIMDMCYNLSIRIDSVLELAMKQAIHLSGKDIPLEEVMVGIRGDLKV